MTKETIPVPEAARRGEKIVNEVIRREWQAHRTLWIGLFVVFILVALGWPAVTGATDPVETIIRTLTSAVFSILMLCCFALLLIRKSVRGMAKTLPEAEQADFLTGADHAIMQWVRTLLLVFAGAWLLIASL